MYLSFSKCSSCFSNLPATSVRARTMSCATEGFSAITRVFTRLEYQRSDAFPIEAEATDGETFRLKAEATRLYGGGSYRTFGKASGPERPGNAMDHEQ